MSRPLVTYRGYVPSIDLNDAHVRLTDDLGQVFVGCYPAVELAAAGVNDRDQFLLTTVEDGDAVRFEIQPLLRPKLSAEEQAAISRRVDEEFKDFSLEDDY